MLRSTCMCSARRQRSSWARIKLSCWNVCLTWCNQVSLSELTLASYSKKQRFVPFTVSKAWHLCQFLEWKFIEFSGLFHCLIIKVPSEILDFAAIGFARLLCCFAATCLFYHNPFSLSSTFFNFFKSFFKLDRIELCEFFAHLKQLCYLTTVFVVCQQLF